MTTKDYRKAAGDIRYERVAIRMEIALAYSQLSSHARLRGDHHSAVAHWIAAAHWAWKGVKYHFAPFRTALDPAFKRGGINVRRIGAEPIIPTRP